VGFNLVSSKILDGNGVITMQGLIPAPFIRNKEKYQMAKWGKLKTIFIKIIQN